MSIFLLVIGALLLIDVVIGLFGCITASDIADFVCYITVFRIPMPSLVVGCFVRLIMIVLGVIFIYQGIISLI